MKKKMSPSGRSPLLVLVCLVWLAPPVFADSPDERRELSQWMMNYYQKPTPEKFVQKVKQMSAAGVLHDSKPTARPDANVMFLGKVMAANSGQIPTWMAELSSLPEVEYKTLKRAVWYAGTAEGLAWLRQNGEAELANGPRPLLLSGGRALSLQPYHLDQLWEWFFATGDEEPVIRMVSLFNLAHSLPADNSLELLSPPKKSNDRASDRIRAYNYRLARPALWSTTSLAIEQQRVLDILMRSREQQKNPMTRAWLGQVVKIAVTQRSKTTGSGNPSVGKKPSPDK